MVNHAAHGNIRVAAPKQRTVNIDGAEYPVPEPMREEPELEQRYWYVAQDNEVDCITWRGAMIHHETWGDYRMYTTREEAEQARAIELALYGGED